MASAQVNGAQKQLYHGIPIYGLSSSSRETVLADERSLDKLTTTFIVDRLRLRAIDATVTDVQDAVDEAKFAAAEHLVAQSAFPSAGLRNAIHAMQPPYLLGPPGLTIGLTTAYFDMGQFLHDLRQYSSFDGGRHVYDVAVLVKSQDPAQPVVLNIYQSRPERTATHTLWYIQQMCWIPGAGRHVEMLQALAPSTPPPAPAMPFLPPAPAVPAALPAPPPPAHRAIQPRKPHHHSAAPYAGLTADQILAQVHTEHMFGGVILVLYLTYSKAELMKKLSDRRQQVEGMGAFGPKSQQVVHYRVKNAIEHIFGKANYKANSKALKEAGLHALIANNGEGSSTPSLAYGSTQAQYTPARPLMAPESRGQQNFDRSTRTLESDSVLPSSPPVLLDPALRDDAVPASPAMAAAALSDDMAPTFPAMPASASQDASASNFSRAMEDVQNGAIVASANGGAPNNATHPTLGENEAWFVQWANQQLGNEAPATPVDVDERRELDDQILQSDDPEASPQESQQPTEMQIDNTAVLSYRSSRQTQEQIADTTLSPDNDQQQTQDQSDDTAIHSNDGPRLAGEQRQDPTVSSSETQQQNREQFHETRTPSDEIQQQTREQFDDTEVSSDESPQQTQHERESTAVSPDKDQQQTHDQSEDATFSLDQSQQQIQEQVMEAAVSSGEILQQVQEPNDGTAEPSDGNPQQIPDRLANSAALSNNPQHQTQEQTDVATSSNVHQWQAAQEQSDDRAVSSRGQDLNEDTADSPARSDPQTQGQSEDTVMASDEIQQQGQEQEPQNDAPDDAQDIQQHGTQDRPQEHDQPAEQQIPETEQPDEQQDLAPDWDYFWDWPGRVFCSGCNGAGRHFDDHEKDCLLMFDPEFQ